MFLGVSDPQNIWLAWDGANQAVLGYSRKLLAPRFSQVSAVVLVHTEDKGGAAAKDIVSDTFVLEAGKEFCRPLTLPANTSSVELLVVKENVATPLKTFFLEHEKNGDFANFWIGLLLLKVGAETCEFLWRGPDAEQNFDTKVIAWAAQFRCWSIDDMTKPGAHVAVSAVEKIVPRSNETLYLEAKPYCYEKEDEHHRLDEFAASVKLAERTRRKLAFVPIQFSGAKEEQLRGLYLAHVGGYKVYDKVWKKSPSANNRDFSDACIDILKNIAEKNRDAYLGCEEWRHSADELYQALCCSMFDDFYLTDLTKSSFFSTINIEDGNIILEIEKVAVGDHLVFIDSFNRTMFLDGDLFLGGVAAYRVGLDDLEPLQNIYVETHPYVGDARIKMVHQSHDVMAKGDLILKDEALEWMEQIGFGEPVSLLSPLWANAARIAGVSPEHLAAENSLFQRYGVAWLQAYACGVDLQRQVIGDDIQVDIAWRAIAILGQKMDGEEDLTRRIKICLDVLSSSGSSELVLCLTRIKEFSMVKVRNRILFNKIKDIDFKLHYGYMIPWIKEKAIYGELVDNDGSFIRIDENQIDQLAEKLTNEYDLYREFIGSIEGSGHEHLAGYSESSMLPDEDVPALLAALGKRNSEQANKFQALLRANPGNAFVTERIYRKINELYPDLQPELNAELRKVSKKIEGMCSVDTGKMDAMVKYYQGVGSYDQIDGIARRIRDYVESEIRNFDTTTQYDLNRKKTLPDLAAVMAMNMMYEGISELVQSIGDDNSREVISALRLLMIWPRESQRTWKAFKDLKKDGSILQSIEDNIVNFSVSDSAAEDERRPEAVA